MNTSAALMEAGETICKDEEVPFGKPKGYTEGPCQYLGSEILQENQIWGLWIAAYEKLYIWSKRIETKLRKKTKF